MQVVFQASQRQAFNVCAETVKGIPVSFYKMVDKVLIVVQFQLRGSISANCSKIRVALP